MKHCSDQDSWALEREDMCMMGNADFIFASDSLEVGKQLWHLQDYVVICVLSFMFYCGPHCSKFRYLVEHWHVNLYSELFILDASKLTCCRTMINFFSTRWNKSVQFFLKTALCISYYFALFIQFSLTGKIKLLAQFRYFIWSRTPKHSVT